MPKKFTSTMGLGLRVLLVVGLAVTGRPLRALFILVSASRLLLAKVSVCLTGLVPRFWAAEVGAADPLSLGELSFFRFWSFSCFVFLSWRLTFFWYFWLIVLGGCSFTTKSMSTRYGQLSLGHFS